MVFKGRANEILQVEDIISKDNFAVREKLKDSLYIIWNIRDEGHLTIDGIDHVLGKNQILFLTEAHEAEINKITQARLLKFNRSFYCILDHDSEVGCKGILFFGDPNVPLIDIPEREKEKFEILWSMLKLELNAQDDFQMDMLQILLKRLLILCTRIFKDQNNLSNFDHNRLDVVREFHFLVERHFKDHHDVNYYADKLHRSAKTLSNIFSKMHSKSPLQVIHERILVEARRQLLYTKKPVKEIAYELGYDDLQSFSRFFKSKEKFSPAQYRSNYLNDQEKLTSQQEIMPTIALAL